jgi:hypothetical protein
VEVEVDLAAMSAGGRSVDVEVVFPRWSDLINRSDRLQVGWLLVLVLITKMTKRGEARRYSTYSNNDGEIYYWGFGR